MILVISTPDDPTVNLVLPGLHRAGQEVLCWDEARFPATDRITVGFGRRGQTCLLHSGGDTHDLTAVTAVWDRRPDPVTVSAAVTDPSQRAFAAMVSRRFLDGLWTTLPARWLPCPPPVARLADLKAVQLARAVEVGFTVPDTVITNDPDELVPAWTAAGGALITKAIAYQDVSRTGETQHVYTTRVHRRHLVGRHRLHHAPAILQPDIPKAVELRVTVVGGQLFAVRIDSQSSRRTSQDWRHFGGESADLHPHDLPEPTALACRTLVASLGLSFAAIDLILTPEGEHVFLELNAGGEWGWAQGATGLPIADAIVEWLCRTPDPIR